MKLMRYLISSLFMLSLLTLGCSAADKLLFGFSGSNGGFRAGNNTSAVSADYVDPSGENAQPRDCLEVAGRRLDVDLERSVDVSFPEPLDLTNYRTFSFEMYTVPYEQDPYAAYFAHITLFTSDGTSIEDITALSPGQWSRAGIEIGAWNGRAAITSAKISLMISTTVDGYYEHSFYIDDVTAADEFDKTLVGRYLFDRFSIDGGGGYQNEQLLELVTTTEAPVTMSAELSIPLVDWETDSLRLRIRSNGVDRITVRYSSLSTLAISEEKSSTIKLTQDGEIHSYYINVGDMSTLRTISITLPAVDGMIELHSLAAVSTYTPPRYSTVGTITSCQITDDAKSIRFTGEVGREEALANQNGVILIYAIEPGVDFDESMLWNGEAVLQSPMTTKFDLTLPLEDNPGLVSSRFAAVSRHADGSAVLISAPFHVSNPEKTSQSNIAPNFGAKGIICDDISLCGSLYADSSIITVTAESLFSPRLEGVSREYNGALYYFNESTLSELERKVSALYGDGIDILLRLTGWSDEFTASLDTAYRNDGIDYSSFNSTPDGSDYLAAISDYLAERFFAKGRIDGLILGMGENVLSGEVGCNSVGAIAKRVARELRVISSELVGVNASARVYLSISDAFSIELSSGNSEIGADELLPAVCAAISSQGNFNWGLCIEQLYRGTKNGDTRILPASSDSIIELLRDSGVYDIRLIFCDYNYGMPKQTLADMIAGLSVGYYAAYFENHIDCYFMNITSALISRGLGDAALGIDTVTEETLPSDISEQALLTLGVQSWKELIPSYDSRRLVYKELERLTATENEPDGIKGRFAYYDFGSPALGGGFTYGYACTSIGVESGMLAAKLNGAESKYKGIVHRFEQSETLNPTPQLELTLGVTDVVGTGGEAPKSVGVRLIFMSENSRCEVRTLLEPGIIKTVYANLSSYETLGDITAIAIELESGVISSATLTLGSIVGLSREYNDESLAEVIAEAREKKRAEKVNEDYVSYVWIGGGILVAVATALTVVLLSRKPEEDGDEAE